MENLQKENTVINLIENKFDTKRSMSTSSSSEITSKVSILNRKDEE